MMYSIEFVQSAQKEFDKLPSEIKKRVVSALTRIKIRPFSYVTKLVGDPGYKLRVGDYRILMDIEKSTVRILLLRIAHRKEVYKRLNNLRGKR